MRGGKDGALEPTHAPARVRLCPQIERVLETFQPTHPHGCDFPMRGERRCAGFNPRTRTGCDFCPQIERVLGNVSTHAPARVRPDYYRWNHIAPHVSTHAPHGATAVISTIQQTIEFQLTHPHGVHQSQQFDLIFIDVNHAPARGATGATTHGRRIFQPTHPHGVRHTVEPFTIPHWWFQSTHPHGCDYCPPPGCEITGMANSRTRTGATAIL